MEGLELHTTSQSTDSMCQQPSSCVSDFGSGSELSWSDESMDEHCDDEECDSECQGGVGAGFYPPLQVEVDERGKPVYLSFAHHDESSDDDELFVPRSACSSSPLCHSVSLPQQLHQSSSPPLIWSGKMPLDLFLNRSSSSSSSEDEEEIERKYGSVTQYYFLKGVEFAKKANAIQKQRAASELKVKQLAEETQLMSVTAGETGRQHKLDHTTRDTKGRLAPPLVFGLEPDCESSSVSSVSSEECNAGEEEAMKALKTANKMLTRKAQTSQTKRELAKARTMIKNVERNRVMLDGNGKGNVGEE